MRTILIILGFFLSLSVKAQLAEPVQWSFKAEKISPSIYKLILTAQIEDGWYVYSQEVSGNGPVPMNISFQEDPSIVFEGKPQELGSKKEIFDQNFNMTVTKLLGQTRYEQVVKINGGSPPSVKGSLSYMTCNNEMCLPPKKLSFNISLKPQ